MLAATGFAPRPKRTVRQAPPTRVTGLTVVPETDGSVALSWERGNSAASTMFLVETNADNTTWRIVKSVTRVTTTVTGYAPGVAAWFRVTASTSTAASLPSAPVAIYAPATPVVQLRVA